MAKMLWGVPGVEWLRFVLPWFIIVTVAYAASSIQEAQDPYRLDGSVIPYQYFLRIQPDFTNEIFEGKVTILVTAKRKTNSITLHSVGNNLNAISVTAHGDDAEDTDLYADKEVDDIHQFVIIKLDNDLKVEEDYKITVDYEGVIRDDMSGFYISKYKIGSTEWKIGATQFQATHARKAFPCFDEPSYKARFKITIVTPAGYSSLSNMPVEVITGNEVIFENSITMSSYLVAFAVSNFQAHKITESGVTYQNWARTNAISWTQYSNEVTPLLLWALESYTGILYANPDQSVSLSKLDQVALPDFSAGAMENWGLVTYRESNILFNEGSRSAKKRVTEVIAHELAHMWFGNLVTTKWWDATWLNEGFANYFQHFAADAVNPSWRMMDTFLVDHTQMVFGHDALPNALPLTSSASDPTQVSAKFGTITYSKGGSFLRMLSSILGGATFQSILQSYLEEFKYNSTEPEDLFKHIIRNAEEANLDPNTMEQFLISWTHNPGFPVIIVERDYQRGSATLTQRRFLLNGVPEDPVFYYVPLTWVKEGESFQDTTPQDYIPNTSAIRRIMDMPDSDSWIIFNTQETGYYRVNYDERNWQLIIDYLKNYNHPLDNIHVLNRAQLLDDAFNLARAGQLPYATAFDLAAYLPREHDYVPWAAALSAFSYLDRMFATHEKYPLLQRQLLRLMLKTYKYFDFGYGHGEKDDPLLSLISTWACAMGHQTCIDWAANHLRWELGGGDRMPVETRGLSYCYGVRELADYTWDLVWEDYQSSTDEVERSLMAAGLGCSRNPDRLKQYLHYAIEGSHIRKQDVASVFSAVYSRSGGADIVLEFLKENFEQIVSYYGSVSLVNNIVTGIASRLTTLEQKSKLENIVQNHDIGNVGQAALTTVQSNIDWLSQYQDVILSILEQEDLKQYLIPDNVYTDFPIQYKIRISEVNLQLRYFDATVTINVGLIGNASDAIFLHQDGISVRDISVRETMVSVEELYDYHQKDNLHQMLTIYLKRPYRPTWHTIVIKYSGTLRDDMYGFYFSEYTTAENENRRIAATQFQPTYARRAFPCFDEPRFKAVFDLTIVSPPGYRCLSNMPEFRTHVWDDGTTETEFHSTVIMSTYLLAFVISDFDFIEDRKENEVLFRTWSRPNALPWAKYSIEISRSLLNALEDYTNIKYIDEEIYLVPQNKIDQVAIPDFSAGAMENWGLITYRETALLYNDGPAAARKRVANTIAHELVHMWFGNLVTTKSWDSTWLNEGFAQYFQFYATSHAEPEWRILDQFVVDVQQTVYRSDMLASAEPLTARAYTPAQISARFGTITYSKGASFIRMLMSVLGEEALQKALRNYLLDNKYGATEPQDLFDKITQNTTTADLTAEQMQSFLLSWTTQAGFPLITVTRNYDEHLASVTQKRFLSIENSNDRTLYYVPLTWAKQGENFENRRPQSYIPDYATGTVVNNMPDADEWVIFNVQETGYYRVNYDERNWALIAKHLAQGGDAIGAIHVLNRAQLIDDAFNLARGGHLPYATALDLADYLQHEADFIPWTAAATAFNFLDVMLAGHEKYPIFQRYILRLLDKQYKRFLFHDRESHEEKLHLNRITNLACTFGHEHCRKSAKNYLIDYLDNDNTVPADLRSVVYCNGIRESAEHWDRLWGKYTESLDDAERALIATGLGCSTDAGNLKKLLSYALDEAYVRKQDASSIFSAVYASPFGGEIILQFLSEGDNFEKTRTAISITSVLSGIATRFTTPEQQEKMETFVATYSQQLGSATTSILTTMLSNTDWTSKYVDSVVSSMERKALEEYRLPDTAYPTRYTLTLTPDLDEDRFEGEVIIFVVLNESSDTITLHASGLEIRAISVAFELSTEVSLFDSFAEDVEKDFLHIHLQEEVRPAGYLVTIQYAGSLRNDMYGFYRSTYRQGEETRVLAATQFQPTHARKAFPCFDEPRFRTTFDVAIFNPPGKQVLSNLPVKHVLVWNDQRVKTVFPTTMFMSTYLLAFVVSDFKFVEDKVDGEVPLRTWARPDALAWANYSMYISRRLLNTLEDYTNIKYTDAQFNLDKLDQVAIPDFSAGAIENWGLITYRETALLYNDGPAAARKRVANTIAHELVHMWFGNLVTTKSWDSTWLNEGFAQYFQFYATSHAEPEWRILDQFVVDVQQTVYRSDMLASAEPLTARAYTPAQISARFGTITYSKGASFVRMLNSILGEDVFQSALRKYLQRKWMSTVEPNDLFVHLKEVEVVETIGLTPWQMEQLLLSWTEQPGFPLVTVMRDYTRGTATVTQKRFISIDNPDDATLYFIPLTWVKQGEGFEDKRPQAFIPNDVTSIPISDMPDAESWVIFNVQETGYYRVNYDERNWALIAKHLAQGGDAIGAIHVLNRAQLIDDAFNLARGGHLPYATAFDLADYLQHEADFIPWTAAATAFNFLDVMLAGHEKYPLFQRYILHLLDHQYERFKFEDRETHEEKLHLSRIISLACNHGHDHCRESAKTKLGEFLNNSSIVPADLRSVVYCHGVSDSTDHWDHLWEKYKLSSDDAERALIVTGLGCSTDSETLKKYLQHSIDGLHIRRQDASSVFTAVYTTRFGVEVALEFLDEKFEEILEYYGSMGAINDIVTGIAARLTTDDQKRKLEVFVHGHDNELGTAGSSALETVQGNLNWLSKNADVIIKILENKESSTTAGPPTEPPTTTGLPTDTPTTTGPTSDPSTTENPSTEPDGDGGAVVISTASLPLLLSLAMLAIHLC